MKLRQRWDKMQSNTLKSGPTTLRPARQRFLLFLVWFALRGSHKIDPWHTRTGRIPATRTSDIAPVREDEDEEKEEQGGHLRLEKAREDADGGGSQSHLTDEIAADEQERAVATER